MTVFFLPFILMMSILFLCLNHPLAMGLNLLLQTIIISLCAGISTYSFWFSYILFLIFLGGMLVLFIYVASLASNEEFFFSLTKFIILTTSLITLSMLTIFLPDLTLISNLSNLPLSSITTTTSTPFSIMWIFNYPSMYFTIFIILYLLLTLIVVVKITNLFKGPLRLTN